MSRDAQMILSDKVSALAATAVSASSYDCGVAPDGVTVADPTIGTDGFSIVWNITAAAADTGSETYQFQALVDYGAALASGPRVLATSAAIRGVDLLAGTYLVMSLPDGCIKLAQTIENISGSAANIMRYIGSKVIIAGSAPSLTFSATIVPDSQLSIAVQGAKNYVVL